MNICIIGGGLSSLALAKNLVNKKINVFLYHNDTKKNKIESRTIGISKNNFDFFNKEILYLKNNIFWEIKEIEIFSENNNEKVISFKKDKENLFLIFKNHIVQKYLEDNLKKNKLFRKIKIKNNIFYKNILKEKKYDLIINCDSNNEISENYFNLRINKNYNSLSYTTILKHQKIENNKAIQIFTKIGPIAFLPISKNETSVVFSIDHANNQIEEKEIKNLINKYNKKYKIDNFSKIEKFNLKFLHSRKYYHENIIAFGDAIHKVHPLAGQGFNMVLRDIKTLSEIIIKRIELGLPVDQSICKKFEKSSKHTNLTFSLGIDFIHEVFKFDAKTKKNYLNNLLKILEKRNSFKNILIKIANRGLGN